MKIQLTNLLIFIVLASLLPGCLTYKQIVNFQDGDDLDAGKVDSIANVYTVRIQPDDVVLINVSSYNVEEAQKFNLVDLRSMVMGSGAAGGATVSDPLGYRVSEKGFIDIPVIGLLYIKDLSLEELRELIYKKVGETQYLKDYSVEVRFRSFRITILGEVNLPGTYTVTNSKVSILEAVGMAKDLTIYSQRDNLLVIREQDGKRSYGRVNFKTKEVFESPYFYLKPNDIVYVEPHKSKILSTPDPFTRYLGTLIAFASLVTLIAALF